MSEPFNYDIPAGTVRELADISATHVDMELKVESGSVRIACSRNDVLPSDTVGTLIKEGGTWFSLPGHTGIVRAYAVTDAKVTGHHN